MKGQYLAVESVLTFGLGLILAVGVIGTFETLSSGIYDAAETAEVKIVQSKVLKSIYSLESVEGDASKEIQLPDSIGNSDYTVEASNNITVYVDNRDYSRRLAVEEPITGSASGEAEIIKSDEGYRLSDR